MFVQQKFTKTMGSERGFDASMRVLCRKTLLFLDIEGKELESLEIVQLSLTA